MKQEMVYMAEHGDESPFHLIGHLYLFMDYFSRSSSAMKISTEGRLRDFYVKEALSYIEQNFQNDISVEGIAEFCGLQSELFRKDLQRSGGKVSQRVHHGLPHDKSCGASEATGLSIGDIGNAVGYPNQLHFSRAFKHTYGMSPREWRNRTLENKPGLLIK